MHIHQEPITIPAALPVANLYYTWEVENETSLTEVQKSGVLRNYMRLQSLLDEKALEDTLTTMGIKDPQDHAWVIAKLQAPHDTPMREMQDVMLISSAEEANELWRATTHAYHNSRGKIGREYRQHKRLQQWLNFIKQLPALSFDAQLEIALGKSIGTRVAISHDDRDTAHLGFEEPNREYLGETVLSGSFVTYHNVINPQEWGGDLWYTALEKAPYPR